MSLHSSANKTNKKETHIDIYQNYYTVFFFLKTIRHILYYFIHLKMNLHLRYNIKCKKETHIDKV